MVSSIYYFIQKEFADKLRFPVLVHVPVSGSWLDHDVDHYHEGHSHQAHAYFMEIAYGNRCNQQSNQAHYF